MKKHLFLLALLATGVAAHGYDYPYLTFRLADGTVRTLSVDGLSMGIEGTSLVARGTSETLTLTLADLQEMHFSTDGTTTPVSAAVQDEGPVEAFSTDGLSMGAFSSAAEAAQRLRSGVYVLKTKSGTRKTIVR